MDEEQRKHAFAYGFSSGRAYDGRLAAVIDAIDSTGQSDATPDASRVDWIARWIGEWWEIANQLGRRYEALQLPIHGDRLFIVTYARLFDTFPFAQGRAIGDTVAGLLPPWPDGWETDANTDDQRQQ